MKNHNYTGPHDILSLGHMGDLTLIVGRGLGICIGDTLTLKAFDGRIAKYEIKTVNYPSETGDLWSVKAKFVEHVI